MIKALTHEDADYWLDMAAADLGTFSDVERVRRESYALCDVKELKAFFIRDTGIFAFLIGSDFKGNNVLAEYFFYIKPIYRGDLRLVKAYINTAETLAKKFNCIRVKIGANIDFKNKSFIKLLRRWGYEDDIVSKLI